MGMRDRKIFADALPADGSAQLHDVTNSFTTFGLWGPRARDILGGAADGERRRQPRGLPVPVDEDGRHRRGPDARLADQLRRRARLGDLRPDRAGPAGLGRALAGRPAARHGRRRDRHVRGHGPAREGLPRPRRRARARLRPRRGRDGPADGQGRRLRGAAGLRAAAIAAARGDAVHADRRRPDVVDRACKRYMLGREPVLDLDGQPIVDAKGRGSYVTRAGSGPSVGKHLLMAYLPPEHAEVGDEAPRRVLRRALPGHRRGRRRDAAVRPGERADPRVSPAVNVLVCVKRVPVTGGRIVLTGDGRAIDARFLGFTISPHEECGVEEAVRIVEAHGGSSAVLTLGPDAADGAAPRRAGGGHRAGDPARDRRGRGVGRGRDRRRDRRRGARPGGGRRAVRPHPLRHRGGRHRRLPGRHPGRHGPRPADRQRGQADRGRGRAADRATRGDRRRLGGLRGRRCPRSCPVREGLNLPRYPSVPGRLRAKRQPIERIVPIADGRGTARSRWSGCACRSSRSARPRSWATVPTPRPQVVEILRRLGAV